MQETKVFLLATGLQLMFTFTLTNHDLSLTLKTTTLSLSINTEANESSKNAGNGLKKCYQNKTKQKRHLDLQFDLLFCVLNNQILDL